MPAPRNKEVVAEDRRRKVAANLIGGLNYRDMAGVLETSIATISRDVKIILARLKRETLQDAADWRVISLRRYELLLNGLWEKAAKGENLEALDRLLKIMAAVLEMMGTDSPDLLDLTSGGQPLRITEVVVERPASDQGQDEEDAGPVDSPEDQGE